MTRKPYLLVLLALISSSYFYTATGRAMLDDGDALYAGVAQEMIERDEWVTPYANGVRFLDKPPLMYWLMALSYSLFGVSEFAARLPSVLAVLGTGWLLYLMGRRSAGQTSGFTAGIAAAFCVGTFLFTRMVFPDILFVFFLTLALSSFLQWYSDPGDPLLPALVFFAALAGGLLTKGLIGVVFPAAIVGLFLILTRDWRRLKGLHWLQGGLLFLGLALPWHIIATRRNSGFFWYYFVNEQFLRFLGRRQPVDYESISVPVFWLLLLLWLFPWSVFFPAIRHLLNVTRVERIRGRAVVWLSVSWVAVVLTFFSFSSRLEHYALPLFPPLALLVGIVLSPGRAGDLSADSRTERSVSRGFAFLGLMGGIAALVLLGALVLILLGLGAPGAMTDEAAQQKVYKSYFGPLFDLPAETLRRLQTPLLGTVVVLSMGLLGAWWINRRGRRIPAVMLLSGMMLAFSLFAHQSIGVCEEVLSSKKFGEALKGLNRPGDIVVNVGDFETANSINFYSRLPLEIYRGRAAVLEWGLRYPDAPERILTREALLARWLGPERTFVLCPDGKINGLGLSDPHVVMNSAGRTLLCNQPIR